MIYYKNNPTTIPLEEFFEAYEDCRKNKRGKISCLEYDVNYEINLISLWKRVNSGKYVIGKSNVFLVYRPKLREVFAANFEDRIIHHLIMRKLTPLMEKELTSNTYNCRTGKGVLYGVKDIYTQIQECQYYFNDCYIAKFDLKGFFMSIPKSKLLECIKILIINKYKGDDINYLLLLCEQVILNKPQNNCSINSPKKNWKKLDKSKSLFTSDSSCGIPIGNLTSQCFANYFLNEFDHWMDKTFFGYGRYVDDFVIIHFDKSKILKFIPKITKYLKNLGLTLHPNKIYIQTYYQGVKFIGAVIKENRVYINNRTVANIYSKIRYYKKHKYTRQKLLSVFNSYQGFLRQYRTYNIQKKIINKVEGLPIKLVKNKWIIVIT